MKNIQPGSLEADFADIIWQNEPIMSSLLVRLCSEKLGWKKSTTFTVLRRLCEKGIFKNESGSITSCVTRDEFYAMQSERFVEDTFGGSLPAFIAAFTKRKPLKESEIESIRRMIEEYEER